MRRSTDGHFTNPRTDDFNGVSPMRAVRLVLSVACLAAVSAALGQSGFAQNKPGQGVAVEQCVDCANAKSACRTHCRPTRAIWCPDDYCPKCPPRICLPKYCGSCNNYDAKCAPCICLPKYCGSCDDYDAKCLPCLKIPCRFPSFYRCPPPRCGAPLAAKPITTETSCK